MMNKVLILACISSLVLADDISKFEFKPCNTTADCGTSGFLVCQLDEKKLQCMHK